MCIEVGVKGASVDGIREWNGKWDICGIQDADYLSISTYYYSLTQNGLYCLLYLYISKWRRWGLISSHSIYSVIFFSIIEWDDEGRRETAAKKSFWRGFVIISRHVVLSTSSYQHTHHKHNRTYVLSLRRAIVSSRISVFFSLSLSLSIIIFFLLRVVHNCICVE